MVKKDIKYCTGLVELQVYNKKLKRMAFDAEYRMLSVGPLALLPKCESRPQAGDSIISNAFLLLNNENNI